MIRVFHMSGAGNDFAVVDVRGQKTDLQKLAVKLCKLTGADGFLAVDESDIADFRLHFYNPDGLRGEMCGNGARCVCKFAYDLGIAGETMTVQTDAGLVYGTRMGENRYQVKLNPPGILDLNRTSDCAYVELGDPGIPHAVTQVHELSREKLRQRGIALRHDPAFPKGANVNFYTRLSPDRVRLLTYERGVEDFTLACGTGSASVAVVLWKKGQLPEGRLIAENEGGTLTVTLSGENGKVTQLLLEGPAEIVNITEL